MIYIYINWGSVSGLMLQYKENETALSIESTLYSEKRKNRWVKK